MKTIFSGGGALFRVYTGQTLKDLCNETGAEPVNVSVEEIKKDPSRFRDTENIFTTWGMFCMTEDEIGTYLPSLKCIYYGAGSVQSFARPFLHKGVRIFSSWGANAVPVAEYTVAQIVLANKGFFLACRRTKSPQTRNKATYEYSSLMPGNYEARVGIIGAGMIGKIVIRRLKDYHLSVCVYDPFLSEEAAKELDVEKVSLDELFSTCQVISNHVANLPSTVGMLKYEHFSRMKKDGVFINTGRGAQVVESDLIRALKEEPDRCAILDVTMPEPPTEDSPFYTMENVFLTPHIAGSSGNEVARMGDYMLDQYRKVTAGNPCEFEVFEKMLETMA